MKTASVIGIGRVGLPLALVLADKGYKVYGIDVNSSYIQSIKKDGMPFMEAGADALLKKHLGKRFIPTTSYSKAENSDVILLTLGTPIDENMNPVLDQIDVAMKECLPFLKKGQLIILRSTVSPRTTQYVKNTIDRNTKLFVGKEIFLAFCPERIAEGVAIEEMIDIPQIVGGVDKESTKRASAFFTGLGVQVIETDDVSSELAKLFTNMYRYISFAIPNEFMIIAESFDRNIHEIINLVNKDYKRGGLALPGLTAGPCLFKDGFFLINENPYLDLITTSWKINETIPLFLLRKVKKYTTLRDKRVAILGLAFKSESDDTRESLSFKLKKALQREYCEIILHDPYVKSYKGKETNTDLTKILKNVDVVFITVPHKYYKKEYKTILKSLPNSALVCDVWNTFGCKDILLTVNDIKSRMKVK